MPNPMSTSNKTEEIKLSTCADSSVIGRLDEVIVLWKKNRKTLGVFPKGAFEDHAKNNWIIYLLAEGKVKGYLLYRIARNRAVIAHLCISDELRGQGGARELFHELKSSINDGHCRGVEVRCRSDYAISRMWPKLGFECNYHIRGRAKEGSELTVWFYRFDVNDLFYNAGPKQNDDDLTWAVLDSNIIFKLNTPNDRSSEEAIALNSDAISLYARYFITPEIFIEIERKINPHDKKSSSSFARKFEKIEPKIIDFELTKNKLMHLWDNLNADRDRSDLNHIAYTASAGLINFITQDEELLEKADAIYEVCGVNVLRPVEFITELDQLENADKYNPKSLSRTKYTARCPSADEISDISTFFCLPHLEEKRKHLEAKLRAAIANPNNYKTVLFSEDSGAYIALICLKKEAGRITITLMRHNNKTASKTIAQNFIWDEIFSTSNKNINLIEFIDNYSASLNSELFQSSGFINNENGWIRVSANITTNFENAKAIISNFFASLQDIEQETKNKLIKFIDQSNDNHSALEEAFWPLKIENANIPTYLVPIKPVWALHLFDSNLAEQDLWGADPDRHLILKTSITGHPSHSILCRALAYCGM